MMEGIAPLPQLSCQYFVLLISSMPDLRYLKVSPMTMDTYAWLTEATSMMFRHLPHLQIPVFKYLFYETQCGS